jgi:hypothetical protein
MNLGLILSLSLIVLYAGCVVVAAIAGRKKQ